MADSNKPNEGQLLLYHSQAGAVRIEVLYQDDTFWLNQKRIAELFGVDLRTVSEHFRNIFASGELRERTVLRKIRTTAADGKNYSVNFYNLDAIISVGYRVNSTQATQFRIWATQTLREFVTKGFVLDDERLKLNKRFGRPENGTTGKRDITDIASRNQKETKRNRESLLLSDTFSP